MLTVSGRESSDSEQDSDVEIPGSELIRVPVELTEEPETQSQEPENLPEEPGDNPPLRGSTRSQQPSERYGQ